MRVDQHAMAGVVLGLGKPGKMDLADMFERKGVEIGTRVEAVIGRRNQHVADVEKEAAAGASGDLADEVGLGDRAFLEN